LRLFFTHAFHRSAGGTARQDEPTCPGKAGQSESKIALRMVPHLKPFSVGLFQTSLKVRAELFEVPKTDSVANFAHDVKVKVDVVVGV
jgi:hypothetical protein